MLEEGQQVHVELLDAEQGSQVSLTPVLLVDGDVVLASDAAHFREELELRRPFAVLHDLERMYAAYDLLEELAAAGAVVVPGHDPGVASVL